MFREPKMERGSTKNTQDIILAPHPQEAGEIIHKLLANLFTEILHCILQKIHRDLIQTGGQSDKIDPREISHILYHMLWVGMGGKHKKLMNAIANVHAKTWLNVPQVSR